MKKLNKVLVSLFSAVCVACACAGFSACFSSGGNGENDSTAGNTGNENGDRVENLIDKWNRYDGVKLSFLSEADFSDGEIDEERLVPELNCNTGDKHYMVLDFDIQAEYDNDGRDTVTAQVNVHPVSALAATIQDTNTGNVSEEVKDDIKEIKATYKIPDKAETVRNMRLVIQFEALASSEAYIDVSFSTDSKMQVIKTSQIKKTAMCGTAESFGLITYELNDGAYTVTDCKYTGRNVDLVIPSMWNGRYVTAIGDSAFKNITKVLKGIIIPDTVSSLGGLLFADCTYLQSIKVSAGNENFKSEGNCLLSKDGKTLLYGCRNSVVPDGVEEIGENAFYQNYLLNLNVPDSVTKIGENAFFECKGLNEINISDLSVWFNISFANRYANPLYKGHCLYINGEFVKNLVVPDGVTEIADNLFYCCKGIVSVTVPASVKSIGNGAFANCTLTNLYLTEGLKEIGINAFASCTSLASFEMPQSVQSVGMQAFWGCEKLSGLNLDNLKSIGNSAFQACTSLTSVSLSGVEGIGSGAFSGCTKLSSVNIGYNVEEIGNYAFSNCSNLYRANFGGTIARWNKIADNTVFAFCGDNFKLYCNDGSISGN